MLAVLDWELSTLGDPLADFAYHCMQWHMPTTDAGAGTGSLVAHDLKALGIPSMSEYVDAYVARTGLDPRPYIDVYSAYNFFRLAAILQGIVGRVRDGTATNENAPARAQMVRPLAMTAWEFAAKLGRSEAEMKTFALALGAGGARGLAHIAIVEALDEMGVKPVALAGSSIGAVIAAGYAAGLTGRAMRRHLLPLAHDRERNLAARDGRARGRVVAAARRGLRQSVRRRSGEILRRVSRRPAAGEFRRSENPAHRHRRPTCTRAKSVVISDGPLKPAVAASMAVPGLVQPVEVGGRVLVDGGVTDPLPFGCLRGKADVIVAVDVSGGTEERGGVLDPWNSLMTTISVMSHTIMQYKLKEGAPDLVLRPNIGIFRMLDFMQASAILRAAEPVKAEVKEKIGALLS